MLVSRYPISTAIGLPALAGIVVGAFCSLYMGLATFAYFLMTAGLYFRRSERDLHRKLMFCAMGIDFSLVLLLEIQRGATGTVTSMELTAPQFGHVAASTVAILLYVPMILLGKKLWAKETLPVRMWHRQLGITAFTLRTIGFLLMFSMMGRYP